MELTSAEAQALLDEASQLNPGAWVAHSVGVARAARLIAAAHPTLDSERAYVLGLLHDIGRRAGPTDMRHVIDGYTFLESLGFAGAARICLTHSFPVPDPGAGAGQWDCTPAEYEFVRRFLSQVVYDDYDRLVQLCDCLAMPSGFCLIEKRLVDVALRHGFNELTLVKWRAFLQIQQDFEGTIGRSIYELLPGVVENTIGVR